MPCVPRIEQLCAVCRDGVGTVSFITLPPSTCKVCVSAPEEPPIEMAESRPRLLHIVRVPCPEPERSFTVSVHAVADDGGEASAATTLTTACRPPTWPPLSLPLETISTDSGGDLGRLPTTFGLPLPEGAVYTPHHCRLRRAGAPDVLAQLRPLAHWPDGSVRWVLVDAPGMAETAVFAPGVAPPAGGLQIWDGTDCVAIDAGPLKVEVQRDSGEGLCLYLRDGAGTWQSVLANPEFLAETAAGGPLFAAMTEDVRLEEAGPWRAVIRFRVPYTDSSGIAHLCSSVRLHVYAGHPCIRLEHRLEVISHGQGQTTEETPPVLQLRALVLNLPLTGVAGKQRLEHTPSAEAPAADSGNCRDRVWDCLLTSGTNCRLGIGLRAAWHRYPQAVEVDAGGVRVELLAARGAVQHAAHAPSQAGGEYALVTGQALTSDLLLYLPPTALATEEQSSQPFRVRPAAADDPAAAFFTWFATPTCILPPADAGVRHVALDPFIPYEFDLPCARRAWRCLQDAAVALQVPANPGLSCPPEKEVKDELLTACREFYSRTWAWLLPLLHDGARRLADSGTVNYARQPEHIGAQRPGAAARHVLSRYRERPDPVWRDGDGSSPAQARIAGLLLHGLMTGDAAVLESLAKTRAWLLDDRWFDVTGDWQQAYIMPHLTHLLLLGEVFGDPHVLTAAAALIRCHWLRQATGTAPAPARPE